MAVFSTADFAAGFGFGLQQNSLLVRCWRMERQEFQGIFFSATLEAFLEPWKATPLTFAPGFPDFHSISLLL
jgi:hypothetical protein